MAEAQRASSPGTSPFHAKGKLWAGVRKHAVDKVPGGLAAVLEAIGDPHLRTFFEQPFLAASWYDILPIVPVTDAIGWVMGISRLRYVQQAAKWQSEQDVRGVYKLLLHVASPEAVLRRYPHVFSQTYDFGNIDITKEDPGEVECTLSGIPEPIATWLKPHTESYLRSLLEAVQARDLRFLWLSSDRDGEKEGIPLLRVQLAVSWTR